MASHRAERVSEALREELEELIAYEMSDPRLGTVYVSEVKVSNDMRQAMVRLGIPGDAEARRATLEVLEHARGFLRRQLSERIRLVRIPDLRFESDSTIEPGRIDHLLKRIRKGRPRDPAAGDVNSSKKDPNNET